MKIVYARFGIVPEGQEKSQSLLTRAAAPFFFSMRVWELLSPRQTVNTDSLLPLRVVHLVQYALGFKPEAIFVEERPSFFGDRYAFSDLTIASAFLKVSDFLLSDGEEAEGWKDFLRVCFPESPLSFGPAFHIFISKRLSSLDLASKLQEDCKAYLPGKPLQDLKIAREIATRLLGIALFGRPVLYLDLSRYVKKFKKHLAHFREIPEQSALPEAIQEMSRQVRNAMPVLVQQFPEIKPFQPEVVLLLFAAQDKLASVFHEVAKMLDRLEPDAKAELADEKKLEGFLLRALQFHLPVPYIERTAAATLYLEYLFQGESRPHVLHFPKGARLAVKVSALARDAEFQEAKLQSFAEMPFLPFGEGPRSCLGKQFVEIALKAWARALIPCLDANVSHQAIEPQGLE